MKKPLIIAALLVFMTAVSFGQEFGVGSANRK